MRAAKLAPHAREQKPLALLRHCRKGDAVPPVNLKWFAGHPGECRSPRAYSAQQRRSALQGGAREAECGGYCGGLW